MWRRCDAGGVEFRTSFALGRESKERNVWGCVAF